MPHSTTRVPNPASRDELHDAASAVPAEGADAGLSRRSLVRIGALTAGVVAVGATAACGGDDDEGKGGPASGSPSAAATSAAAGGATIVALDQVPVGSAVRADGPDGPLVVAQPTAGQVVAFNAKCTHAGCPVKVDGASLVCPCHKSAFEALTGKVTKGPATADLAPVAVKVDGGNVVAG